MAQESILRIVIDSRNAERNAQALDRELRSIQRNGDFASRSMDGFSVACRQLAGYMMGVVTAGAAIAKMDDWTNLNNRLRLVTDSQQELNKAMKDTFDIAQRSGAAWGGTATIYQKVQYNSEKLGLSQEKVAKITESISKSISNSGSSAQAASAALYQLGQAFDKSSLNGDEFVSMSENAGYLMEVFAKGLGVTRAELKEMSSAGELTTDKMVQAIEKMSESIEEDFGKTNFTIGQSITQFSNAATQFIGGAGEASGAALFLSSSIKGLADNLDSIAHIAVLGGVAMLTKAILTQSVAMKKGIADSIADRAAKTAQLESHVRLAALEVQRTRQIASLAAQELRMAQLALVNAKNKDAQAIATQRVATAEVAYALAMRQSAGALTTQTVAQNALNASRAIGTRLLALVGGPIGALTIGVTALAAGYMYMQKRADEANKKLKEQAEVAKKAKEELLALKGLEKDKAVDDMTASFKRQNEALEQSSSTINMQLNAIERLYKGNKEVTQVVQDARNGTIGMNEAVKRFNELRISKEVYNSFKKNAEIFNKNAEEAVNSKEKLKLFRQEVVLAGRDAQTSKFGIKENTEELNKNKTAAEKAAKAQKDYFDSLNQDVISANNRLAYMNFGLSKEVIDQINKLQEEKQKALGDGVTAIVTTEEINRIIQAQNILDEVGERENEIAEAERKQTKELERQVLLRAQGNQQLQNGLRVYQAFVKAGLNSKQALAMAAQVGRENDFQNKAMFGTHSDNNNNLTNIGMLSWQGARGNEISSVLKSRDLLNTDGSIKQTQEAIDVMAKFAVQEILTRKEYIKTKNAIMSGEEDYSKLSKIIGTNFVRWDYAGKKIDAAKHKNKEANYYDQLASIVGVTGNTDFGKSFDDLGVDTEKLKQFQIEQAQSRKALELEVANEVTRIRENLKDKLLEIDKAGFSPERTKELKAEYQARADNEVAIAEYALKTKLDDYSSFQKTETQLLKDSFNQKKFYASRDIELSRDQRNQAIQLLDQQEKYELAVIELAQEQRLFQARQTFMSESEILVNRYKLERAEISKTRDEFERLELQRLNDKSFLRGDVGLGGEFFSGFQSPAESKTSVQLIEDEMFNQETKLRERYEEQQRLYKDNADELIRIQNEYEATSAEMFFEYYDKKKFAQQADHEMQLQLYGQVLSQASTVWNDMTEMVKTTAGESSAAYKGMFLANQAISVGQAVINTEVAATKAMAEGGYIAGIPMSTLIRGLGYASVGLIAGQTIAGFATGGHVRGPGTSTSDSIPAMLSDYEFVTKASAVKKIGVANMEYMNRTGEMPFQREYEELHKRISGNQLPEPFIVPKYKDGGLVGSSRVQPDAYSQIYRERQMVQQSQSGGLKDNSSQKVGSQPIVHIYTLPGTTADTSVNADGVLEVRIRKIMREEVPRIVAGELSSPSSTTSRALSMHTTARYNRK